MSYNQITNFLFNQSQFRADQVDLFYNYLESFKLLPDPREASSTVFTVGAYFLPKFDIHTEFLHKNDNYTFLTTDFDKKGSKANSSCGCDFEDLVNFNKNFDQINFNFFETVCKSPDRLKGRLMKNISPEDLLCLNNCQNTNDCQCHTQEFDQSVTLNCTKFDINDFNSIVLSSQPLSSKYKNLRLDFHNQLKLPVIPKNLKLRLTEIIAPRNSIQNVLIENLASDHLKILNLRDNQISTLSEEVAEKLKGLEEVSLGGNPWICDCSIYHLLNYLYTNNQLKDHLDIYCANLGKLLNAVESNDVCLDRNFLIAILCALFGFVAALIALFYKYNKDIKVFLYHHNLCLWFVTEEEIDAHRNFDAFFCFSEFDQELVLDIIEGLEQGPEGFELLVGARNWMAGQMIPELVSLLNKNLKFFT